MATPDAGFQQALDNVGKHLASDDPKAQAAAAVTLALMLQNTALPADLGEVAARLTCLLDEAAELAVKASEAQCACPDGRVPSLPHRRPADLPPPPPPSLTRPHNTCLCRS